MFCAKCGATLADNAKKCRKCGAPVRIRPAGAERDVQKADFFSQPEDLNMPAPGAVEDSLREDTFMDPVFYEEADEHVDVDAIIRIARGEEIGTDPGAALRERKDLQEDVIGEPDLDMPSYLASLPLMEKARRRLAASFHRREETADERRMNRQMARARKFYEGQETDQDRRQEEQEQKAERAGRPASDAKAEINTKADIKNVSAPAHENAEITRREEARTERERARLEQERERARAEREAARLEQERERARAEREAARLEQERERARAEREAARLEQEREIARAEREAARLEAESATVRLDGETSPAVSHPSLNERSRIEEEVRIETARRLRRVRREEPDRFDHFLGKYGLSKEMAVRLATLFLIAVLSLIYVLGRGGRDGSTGNMQAGDGVTAAPAAAAPGAEQDGGDSLDQQVPTGGGDFGNSENK